MRAPSFHGLLSHAETDVFLPSRTPYWAARPQLEHLSQSTGTFGKGDPRRMRSSGAPASQVAVLRHLPCPPHSQTPGQKSPSPQTHGSGSHHHAQTHSLLPTHKRTGSVQTCTPLLPAPPVIAHMWHMDKHAAPTGQRSTYRALCTDVESHVHTQCTLAHSQTQPGAHCPLMALPEPPLTLGPSLRLPLALFSDFSSAMAL